jgi:hypothetical protein
MSERAGNKLKASSLRDSFLGRALVDAVLLPSDILKINTSFKSIFGQRPNLFKPNSFNEKLQQFKLTRRLPRYTQYADKVGVRDFVSQAIGEVYLTKLLWHGSSLHESWRDLSYSLPDKFIVKTNHGSGSNIICFEKSSFDWTQACQKTNQWLHSDHSKQFAEWQYRWINPQVLIEELLVDDRGKIPVDYKFFCFGGKVKYIQVDFDRASHHTRLLFNSRFERQEVEYQYPKYTGLISPPKELTLMTELAEKLAKGEDFIRVDLYEVCGRIFFGELTLHPEAGLGVFSPNDFDSKLGLLLQGACC